MGKKEKRTKIGNGGCPINLRDYSIASIAREDIILGNIFILYVVHALSCTVDKEAAF